MSSEVTYNSDSVILKGRLIGKRQSYQVRVSKHQAMLRCWKMLQPRQRAGLFGA